VTALDRVQTLWELFLAGGLLMWPIVAMSLVVMTFGIERAIALRSSRFVPRGLREGVARLASAGGVDAAGLARLCAEHPSVAAEVIRAMLARTGRPLPEVERAAEVAKEREASRLYANVRPIALAVTVTPLLGLLGTVQGMIIAFYTTAALDSSANRTAELARGIYVALITTFAGLCVAIPAAVLAHWLEGRIQRGFRQVDDVVDTVLVAYGRHDARARAATERRAAEPAREPR
jgi:biopolymer transport protein ExbB